ncbi:MAG: T9SS type A sorting domain-containing protein [Candidatus Cloacimonetes bacterium]|nr:T9SS type A sorting domain-containing protein [Candidatus Cloacimonadota bacterium]
MKSILVFFIIITGVIILSADLNDPVLAITTADDYLIYDQEKGIIYDGMEIYLTCFRATYANSIFYYELVCVYSQNNGADFMETHIADFAVDSEDATVFVEHKYAPMITQNAGGDLLIFYTDPEDTLPKVVISIDNGYSFSAEPFMDWLSPRCQYQVLMNGLEIEMAAIEEETQFPLSSFQSFHDTPFSENDEYTLTDRYHYWGHDVFWGKVHCNGDLWIQQAGGGPNSGWPTFHGMVTTSGRIMDYTTGQPAEQTAPMQDIFQGGWRQNTVQLELPALANDVRENGFILDESSNHDIVWVQLQGNSALLRYADLVTHVDTFVVYNSFPDAVHEAFPIGDSIWTNEVEIKELEWAEETFMVNMDNSSVFVYCELWIEGAVGTNMTWASADTVYITGDIYYDDIDLGDPAEESAFLFGLISEEKLLIKYKFRDNEGEVHADNCDGIYLYGSYTAIGDGDYEIYGDMNTHYEGIFSFEYAHPHGSTPAFTYTYPGGEEWQVNYPDFHKFIYPPSAYWSGDPGFLLHGNDPVNYSGFYTCGYPYEDTAYGDPLVPPYGTDWPGYNPVYPEAANTDMGKRGIIRTYGGIQQRRWGFIHRSGTDPLNHDNNEWDIEHWNYGGTHGSTGYIKNFNFDERLQDSAPPDYPVLQVQTMGNNAFADGSTLNIYEFILYSQTWELEASFELPNNRFQLVDICHNDAEYAFLLVEDPAWEARNYLVRYSGAEWSMTEIETSDNNLTGIDFLEEFYVINAGYELNVINSDGVLQTGWLIDSYPGIKDYTGQQRNLLHYIEGQENICEYGIVELLSPGNNTVIGNYEFNFAALSELVNPDLNILLDEEGQMVMQILDNETQESFRYTEIYLATGNIAELPLEEDIISTNTELHVYPNPFNPVINISFQLAEPGLAEIEIYNLKGQLVETLLENQLAAGEHQTFWNASYYSSGIYFLEFRFGGNIIKLEKIILLK